MGPAPARARRAASASRTRAVVGGASVATFLAVLAAVGLHGRTQPASNVTAGNDGAVTNVDPGLVLPDAGPGDPFSRDYSGGGFSATPGSGGGSAHTRSHGS
jgi:hypothetical protein